MGFLFDGRIAVLRFRIGASLKWDHVVSSNNGGGCLNEALNWSVKGLGGLTFCAAYSPNLLLIVSHKSQLRLLLIIINPHLFILIARSHRILIILKLNHVAPTLTIEQRGEIECKGAVG